LDTHLKKILDRLNSGEICRIIKSGPATQIHLARYLLEQGKDVALVLPSSADLPQYRALINLLFPVKNNAFAVNNFWERAWVFFPDFIPGKGSRQSLSPRSLWGQRWAALFSLVNSRSQSAPKAVVLSVDNFLPLFPPEEVVKNSFLYLAAGEEYPLDNLLEKLISWGYERLSMVTRPGEISRRGDILDIFAPGYAHPVRIEFFGDFIENIRLFEPVSQRSRQDLQEVLILPVVPDLREEKYKEKAREKIEKFWVTGEISKEQKSGFFRALEDSEGNGSGSHIFLPGLYYEKPASLGQFLAASVAAAPDKAASAKGARTEKICFLFVDGANFRSRLDEAYWSWQEWTTEQCLPLREIVHAPAHVHTVWKNSPQIFFDSLIMGQKTETGYIELPEKKITSFFDLFWKPEHKAKPWSSLLKALKEWNKTYHQVILSFHNQKSRQKFLKLVTEEKIFPATDYTPQKKGLFALISSFSQGMELSWNHVLILAEEVIQPTQKQSSLRKKAVFQGLRSFDEIADNDLLVHRDYGLARFGGLKRIKVGNVANDYLLLLYAGGDKLYLPVDRLNLVQKYKGPENVSPALDKLGGTGWQKTRDRVRKAIARIARDLVNMYAYRKVAKGFTYGPIDEAFREFEASFGFDETPDQEKAIKEVLADMEKPEPMDRLVCGDVGFGKTEVAMRAAFRAVIDGKQVALLCPTTVLAEQHYQNFRQRMEDFGVKVAMLSRFVPRTKQKLIVAAAKRGEIDILIGTHRLLSGDVFLPKLSLLILDEEQRFGVKHKEKLKKLRQNIDVLTLTATPIPRTLQLSLSGIRTLSVIETPPAERKPVQTAIIERDPKFLKEVLLRELKRGGQVFWVYNRVQGLDQVLTFVSRLAPEARVAKAHGQMAEKELEETMHMFWHQEIDILVCTSIIESGLDFPKANTLIVDQAQLFGLGQLYQLRGRVGRSGEQAYAYFIVPAFERLSEQARKRMQIILDMDYLGAGFQIAMQDLRLRGAGNILGEAQSGHIGKVGLDLFLEMLDEEVRKLKGEARIREVEPELNIGFTAHIPEDFIVDTGEKLKYYKMLSSCVTDQDFDEIKAEIRDRFGKIPDELETFIQVLKVKQKLSLLNVSRADLFEQKIIISWPEDRQQPGEEQRQGIDPLALVGWVEKNQTLARLLPPGKLELRLKYEQSISEGLGMVAEKLNELIEMVKAEG
jgi:transcription-repair coupling factor (superfamily II helicase)